MSDARPLVLHVATSLDFGGVESHLQLLAEGTRESEFRHQFVALGTGGRVAQRLDEIGASPILLNQSTRIPSLSALVALLALFRRLRPQVVHLHGAEANFHGLIAGRIAWVPVCICEEIGIASHSRVARRVFRGIYAFSDGVIAVSEAVRQHVDDLGELGNSRVHVVYSPARLHAQSVSIRDTTKPRVGYVGRFEAVKNPLGLIRAAAILHRAGVNAELWMMGDGSQLQCAEAEIADLGLAGVVHLCGYRADPMEILENCDLLVLPSLTEGLGLAAVEAMSAGLPVLATAAGGATEFIVDGVTGWLLGGTEPEDIARGIRRVMGLERAQRASVAAAGRGEVHRRFSVAAYVDRLEAVYREHLDC